MGWFAREGRSELSWVDQTLGSISLPPLQLLAFLGLVIFLLSMSTHTSEPKAHIEREKTGLNLLLYLLPLALLLVTYVTMKNRVSYAAQAASLPTESGCSPWGVAFFVILVLVLVKYHY